MKKTLLIMSLAWLCVGGFRRRSPAGFGPDGHWRDRSVHADDGWTLPKGEWSLGLTTTTGDRSSRPCRRRRTPAVRQLGL